MMRLALHWQILIAMLLGAALGIGLNAMTGRQTAGQTAEYSDGEIWSLDTPERVLIELRVDRGEDGATELRRYVVGESLFIARELAKRGEPWPAAEVPNEESKIASGPSDPSRVVVTTLKKLKSEAPDAFALFQEHGRSSARLVGDWSKRLGDLFLRMLKMVSIPLIITSLLSGVTGLGQAERLGKMFGRTLLYYFATSMLAISVGLLMVNLIQPGVTGVEQTVAESGPAGRPLGEVLFQQLENMLPSNPFAAIATGNFLSIITFTLAFGICTILVGGPTAQRIGELVEAAFQVMMKMTMLIIRLAPIGVFFLMLSATASQGAGVFRTLGWYMFAVACALAVHAMIILPAILYFVAKRSPWEFAKAMSPALLTAFSSASSNGTLPLTMTCMAERAKVSNRVGSFVLPLGATINMDGTALYEVVAVLFIAQFTGHDLSLADQILVAFTALLASVGAAGIPHAGLVMMVIILQAVGLPTETQGLILAVDRVLDMCRTSVNVWSDSCGCAVISRFEAQGDSPSPAMATAGDVDV